MYFVKKKINFLYVLNFNAFVFIVVKVVLGVFNEGQLRFTQIVFFGSI